MSWLWRNDSSAASFEKALQKLSAQINSSTVSLDKTRTRQRRAKALWTLYTSLAYLISALILVLVIGPQDWDLPHYGSLVGGPLLIFAVRKGITAAFGWSIARQQAHVERLQTQREEKITALKKATKYDSTQELLQKYGGAPPQKPREEESKQGTKRKIKEPQQPEQNVPRTGLPPPPTANISSRRPPTFPPSTPNDQHRPQPASPQSNQSTMRSPVSPDEPGFAPNAFIQAAPSRAAYEHVPHWYDRILDVMLGEDEHLAKNRLALLCQNCRLVNGQAPPGVKTIEELGRWRCQSCGAWNGVQEMTETRGAPASPTSIPDADEDAHAVQNNMEEHEGATGLEDDSDGNTVTKRVTRSAGKADSKGL
ncbi:hypothetical protein PMZ80_009116 [Knufia obscura]|uniref:Endoplasmic reticulum junction formation protein lunapark n=2 Tax=Knufia TaxID=430999 RepID=A0AAN8EG19_9EURO|nr:hypothetical protein PMZ80_009116 [Knufia obscura]KAK5954929.1 hypothetical protein OHC33_003608 [Knufia fluminis]